MDVVSIDHLNLRIPEDGVETAVEFYRDRLGQDIEGMDTFEAGGKPFFDVRLAPAHVLHLWPTPDFESPSRDNYNHVALLVDADIEEIRAELDAAGVEVVRSGSDPGPRGATGTAPAVYVRDPFGYEVELKQAATGD